MFSPGVSVIDLKIKASTWIKVENRSRLAAEPPYLPETEDYGVVLTYSDHDMFACVCTVYLSTILLPFPDNITTKW